MARPRVFISSTFYDLRQVRADLEQFVREMGYEPVLNERGSIPYGSSDRIEEFAYREVDLSDILVAIIGGRFGTQSSHDPYSISQTELRRAVELGKQLYVFVQGPVLTEYRTFLENKATANVRYRYVDDVKVYEFLEEVHQLPKGNPIADFETAQDIVRFLKEQWAGLLHRHLQGQERQKQSELAADMQATATTLKQLVTFLTEERRNQDGAIEAILLLNHPVFQAIKKVLNVPYRVFFVNRTELVALLEARAYKPRGSVDEEWPGHEIWVLDLKKRVHSVYIRRSVFEDDDRLKVITAAEWDDRWVFGAYYDKKSEEIASDDDIPF